MMAKISFWKYMTTDRRREYRNPPMNHCYHLPSSHTPLQRASWSFSFNLKEFNFNIKAKPCEIILWNVTWNQIVLFLYVSCVYPTPRRKFIAYLINYIIIYCYYDYYNNMYFGLMAVVHVTNNKLYNSINIIISSGLLLKQIYYVHCYSVSFSFNSVQIIVCFCSLSIPSSFLIMI